MVPLRFLEFKEETLNEELGRQESQWAEDMWDIENNNAFKEFHMYVNTVHKWKKDE